MRISELSTRSGVPVPTIKYYLREGLVPEGVRSSPTQAEYDDVHLQRLRVIRALVGSGVSVAETRKVLAALDRPAGRRPQPAGRGPRRGDARVGRRHRSVRGRAAGGRGSAGAPECATTMCSPAWPERCRESTGGLRGARRTSCRSTLTSIRRMGRCRDRRRADGVRRSGRQVRRPGLGDRRAVAARAATSRRAGVVGGALRFCGGLRALIAAVAGAHTLPQHPLAWTGRAGRPKTGAKGEP